MINGEQLLAALAHCALRTEEIFGRGFISYERIMSEVAQSIDGLSNAFLSAADEAAAFMGRGFAGVFRDFISLVPGNRNHRETALGSCNRFPQGGFAPIGAKHL